MVSAGGIPLTPILETRKKKLDTFTFNFDVSVLLNCRWLELDMGCRCMWMRIIMGVLVVKMRSVCGKNTLDLAAVVMSLTRDTKVALLLETIRGKEKVRGHNWSLHRPAAASCKCDADCEGMIRPNAAVLGARDILIKN